jgi:hypothetical protein
MLKIEIDDLKMLRLKYVAGVGKSLKRKPTVTEEELKPKQKKYEENRKTRKFNEKWKQAYDWLMYDSDKNIMQCSVCLNHNGQGSKFTNLKGQNKFLKMTIVYIADEEDESALLELCEKDDMDNDEYCEGFLSEIENWNQILLFSRE